MKLPEYRNNPPLYHSTDSPFMMAKIILGVIMLLVCIGLFFWPLLLLLSALFH